MKVLAVKDLVGKSIKELIKLRNKLRKEFYDLRLKNSLRSLQQTHLLKIARRNIAKVNAAIGIKIKQ